MAFVYRSVLSVAANTCCSNSFSLKKHNLSRKVVTTKFRIGASSDEIDNCNVEECAPDKEVGKVSMEWLAGEKTKVAGTFPPRKRGWTGYVEKDTAGQTNIYSVEPVVYVAESAISSGSAGSSSDGAQNTAAVAAGLALISIAAASSILLQVNKNPPQIQTTEYSGPALSYYMSKFKPPEIIQASSQSESSLASEFQNSTPELPQVSVETANELQPSLAAESESVTPEAPQVQIETANELQPSTSNVDNVS